MQEFRLKQSLDRRSHFQPVSAEIVGIGRHIVNGAGRRARIARIGCRRRHVYDLDMFFQIGDEVFLGLLNKEVHPFLLGFFVFDMPVKGSIILLLAESLLFIIMSLSLGIFISTVSKTQQVAMMISMLALMLPTMLLSGFIFPIENMPVALQYFCQLMPPKWFIIIIKDIMLKGVGFAYIWKETLILVAMTLFFIGLSVRRFKIRLE